LVAVAREPRAATLQLLAAALRRLHARGRLVSVALQVRRLLQPPVQR
jgi:hypothetical protein